MSAEPHAVARGLLAAALRAEPDDIPDDAAIGTFGRWDSLGHARLVLAIETHLGEPLPAATLVEIASLDDVAELIAAAG